MTYILRCDMCQREICEIPTPPHGTNFCSLKCVTDYDALDKAGEAT